MKFKQLALGLAAAVALTSSATAYELTLPTLDYRTGPYAPNGIPFANGYADYLTLLNERDGGINGTKIKLVPCETGYNTKKGVECYEKTKKAGSGALVYQPLSTGITYQLIPKASADGIPVYSMGYGRTSAANGKVFKWIFNVPLTYWDGATVAVQHAAEIEGGMDKLKGKKIALVYHNSAYGKEPIKTLQAMEKKFGFKLMLLPVDHPGQEQKATWLQIRRERPDWVFMWGWGVMNQVAIKEASSIRFPMDRFIGVWWSGSENDVKPAGAGSNGYKALAFHGVGADYPAHADILKHVYETGKAVDPGFKDRIGEVLYNRGMIAAVWTTEAIRTAMKIHNTKEITAAQMRDGMEALDVSEARLAELGLPKFTYAVKTSCDNHKGAGKVAVQQWDAKAGKWKIITGWYTPMDDITGPLIAADSASFAKENKITPRDCK